MAWTPGFSVPAPGSDVPGEPGAAQPSIVIVGSGDAPEDDAGAARPDTDSPVYWLMANGVTPSNAVDGDIIWNADA